MGRALDEEQFLRLGGLGDGLLPEKHRDYARILFTDPAMRTLHADWDAVARLSAAMLRPPGSVGHKMCDRYSPPTPDEARAALAEAARIRASATALSATPWPTWFATVLTAYIAAFPITYGGMLSDERWLLPRAAWVAVLLIITVAYLALLTVAARSWKQRTGVALRFDVLPRRATVPLSIGMPVLLVGPAWVFRATGQAWWLAAASAAAAAVSVGFHLAFVRLHRKAS